MQHQDARNGSIGLSLLPVGSKLPSESYWPLYSARLPTMVALEHPINELRSLIYPSGGTQRLQSSKGVPIRGRCRLQHISLFGITPSGQ